MVHALAFVAHAAQAMPRSGSDLAAALASALCLPSQTTTAHPDSDPAGDTPAAVTCPICTAGVGLHALQAPAPASLPNRIAVASCLAPASVAGQLATRELDLTSIRGPPA